MLELMKRRKREKKGMAGGTLCSAGQGGPGEGRGHAAAEPLSWAARRMGLVLGNCLSHEDNVP